MAKTIDNGRLSVMLWGQEIGQLCWNPAKGNSYFFFSQEYLASGLDIAPLTASSKSPAARFAIYGNTDSAKYQKLPPFIAMNLASPSRTVMPGDFMSIATPSRSCVTTSFLRAKAVA